MLRSMAQSMLKKYSLANTKLDKSLIISDVVEHIRQNGNFVKRDSKSDQWVLAEDLLCREKISAVFRDALHQQSRSGSGSMPKKAIAQAIEKQQHYQRRALPAMPSLECTTLKQVRVPLPSPALSSSCAPVSSQNFTVDWTTLLRNQHQSPQNTSMSAATAEKKDLFSLFSLAISDINTDDDPFEPKPIFEGNRCA